MRKSQQCVSFYNEKIIIYLIFEKYKFQVLIYSYLMRLGTGEFWRSVPFEAFSWFWRSNFLSPSLPPSLCLSFSSFFLVSFFPWLPWLSCCRNRVIFFSEKTNLSFQDNHSLVRFRTAEYAEAEGFNMWTITSAYSENHLILGTGHTLFGCVQNLDQFMICIALPFFQCRSIFFFSLKIR